MAYKTFISYKYDEDKDVRDRIIKALGSDARYYQGETSFSPNMDNYHTETIRNKLKEMIFDTSITILVLSPRMNESRWIDWEISYSLRNKPRGNKIYRPSGIIAVVKKDYWNGYDWFFQKKKCVFCGNEYYNINLYYLYNIIRENLNNSKNINIKCSFCQTNSNAYYIENSYIVFVEEEVFLNNINEYLDLAVDRSNNVNSYNIKKNSLKYL